MARCEGVLYVCNPSMSAPIDPQRCPICGAENDCAVARGQGACWCFTAAIPDDVLEKIPIEARNLACVCKACAGENREPTDAYRRMQDLLRQRRGG